MFSKLGASELCSRVALPSPPTPLPSWERGARGPFPLLPRWEKGLGDEGSPELLHYWDTPFKFKYEATYEIFHEIFYEVSGFYYYLVQCIELRKWESEGSKPRGNGIKCTTTKLGAV
jgi:hypothetical protein